MTRRRHICDVEGCPNSRKRWQRLCDACFAGLSRYRDVRTGIADAHRTRQPRVKRQWCRRAGIIMGYLKGDSLAPPAPPAPAPQPAWWQRD